MPTGALNEIVSTQVNVWFTRLRVNHHQLEPLVVGFAFFVINPPLQVASGKRKREEISPAVEMTHRWIGLSEFVSIPRTSVLDCLPADWQSGRQSKTWRHFSRFIFKMSWGNEETFS